MDNATRKELLYKARAAGYPGSILDVYANYDQGKDLIAEFQDQQRHQQMSGMAAQQSGLQQGGQQPQIDMQPQPVAMPAIPSSPTPSPNFTPPQPPQPIGVQPQDTPVGIVSGQSGPNQGRAIFATGGFKKKDPTEPIYVYSKDDPAYKKYLKQKAYYDKQKAIYQDIGGGRSYYTTYDELVNDAYKNAAAYNTQFDPNVGLTYSNSNGGYAFKRPTPVILEEESNPEAIDIKPLPMQQVDLKPQLKNASIPLPARKHPVIKSTGDAALDRLNQELYGPSGDYFATGGFTGDPPDWRTILNIPGNPFNIPANLQQRALLTPNINFDPKLGVSIPDKYKHTFDLRPRPKAAPAAPADENVFSDFDFKKMNQDLISGSAVAESTNRNVTQVIPENWQELQKQKIAQDAYDALPEAMKRRDTVSANNTSSTQKAVAQAYYALSNPVEAAGHAMKYGYVPQGNVGNYGLRQDGDAFSDTVNSFVNPFAWGNAAYRFSKDVTNKDSYTTGMGALNMGADLAESLPFFGAAAKTIIPAVKSFASHPLVNGLHDVAADSKLYGPVYAQALAFKAANSLTSPFGIPLYKLPGINKVYKDIAYAVGKQGGQQSRSLRQVKQAIFGKGIQGNYSGGGHGQDGQNALRQYIYGDAANFELSNVPQRGLTKYTEKYGPLDNFKLKMSKKDSENMNFFDIAPDRPVDKWAHLNPSLSHLDALPAGSMELKQAFEKIVKEKGTIPISMKNADYTNTDIAGHTMFLTHDPATNTFSSHIQDIWKFTPEEYAKKWTLVGNPEGALAKTQNLNQYKIYQQAKLMEKAGKPFVTHDVRPFEIFPQFKGADMQAPKILQLADDVDPNATGFKTVTNSINLKKPITTSKKLGGPVCYTCVGRKRRV